MTKSILRSALVAALVLVSGSALAAGVDNPVTPIAPTPPDDCISTAFICRTASVDISRTDAVPLRAVSVTFVLSGNMILCAGTASITEGDYLSSVGSTNFFVTSNGSNSYTVDCGILGLPCGATAASGTLFEVEVKKAPGPVNTGTGTVTVTSVTLRDCNNITVPSSAGPLAAFEIDRVAPVAVNTLVASQVVSANDTDGTTDIAVTFLAPGDAVSAEVWRAPFGNYPEFDDSPSAGSVPATPTYPPGAPWTITTITASGQTDEVATRDFWYYTVFTRDDCGNVSLASNLEGALNYHLGDVHNGASNCAGNNTVTTPDISFFGANYGATLATSDPLACLDVGPTTDFSVNGRPTTDNLIQFEDFVLFAINFGTVSKTGAPAAAASDEIAISAPARVEASQGEFTAEIAARGTGRVQAVSTELAWDPAVVEPVDVRSGELLERQNGLALSARPGVVDAAVLGQGGGLSGEGVLATVRFRVVGSGDPAVSIAKIDARDADNRPAEVTIANTRPDAETSGRKTELLPNQPNPFNPRTRISYRLGSAGEVALSIYAIDGRLVKALERGRRSAGTHELVWDGRNDEGADVSSGTFFMRLETAEGTWSRPLTLIK